MWSGLSHRTRKKTFCSPAEITPRSRIRSPYSLSPDHSKEAAMATYLMLLNWTDQEIKNIKEAPKAVF